MTVEIHDILGIKPYGEMALQVTQAAIDGVSSFLNAVCKPGLEELGYLVKDQVRHWRLCNILRMLEKAKGRMSFDGQELNLCANARVGLSIMECSSEVDDEELQDLWAGLFVSSCTLDGKDDSNMNFVDLLHRMSSVEAKILDYACTHCKILLFPSKLLISQELKVSFEELTKISGINDVYHLDHELDHMRSMELLIHGGLFSPGGGFDANDVNLDANITPSALALSLYYKTHPNGKNMIDFWGDDVIPYSKEDNNSTNINDIVDGILR